MNLETLKSNSVLIKETLSSKFPQNNLAEMMNFMVNGLSETCSTTIGEYLDEVIEMIEFKKFSKKDTGNRLVLGKLAELEF